MIGNLFIVSAPSGAGKSSLVSAVLADDKRLALSVSFTTRPARTGEVNGREYHFVDRKTFDSMLERGAHQRRFARARGRRDDEKIAGHCRFTKRVVILRSAATKNLLFDCAKADPSLRSG